MQTNRLKIELKPFWKKRGKLIIATAYENFQKPNTFTSLTSAIYKEQVF